MVEFLIKRPIAVFMAYLAVVIIGCVTFATLPVSLLPDIDIPNISVHVSSTGLSAREMENTVVSPLRRQLMQIAGLEDISSETRDGSGVIRLTMAYGYSTDLAFIEVNEKIDAAMSSLPSSVARPKAVKASATDIPVVYLYMTSSDNDFAGMGDIADNIIRRRIEQLPQVAMVDITGLPERELKIYPDIELLKSSGITLDDISSALTANNIEQGNMTVKNGQYEYSVHVSNQLRTAADVRAINITKNGLIHTLGDLCRVEETESSPVGYSNYGDSRAVTMSIIKQSSAGMNDMEEALDRTIEYFAKQYPTISFHKSQSQTSMLDYTIGNLKQDLILGLILVFGVCLMFLRSVRLPFIIGITIITSVIVTFLAFYIFGVTINIISLAGLILAVGMMIDNSVIVAENISQWRQRGMSLLEACRKRDDNSTSELIADYGSGLSAVGIHEWHRRRHIHRPGICHHRRSGSLVHSWYNLAPGIVLCPDAEQRYQNLVYIRPQVDDKPL
jgi:multidrug efflux pump subunit AcrB